MLSYFSDDPVTSTARQETACSFGEYSEDLCYCSCVRKVADTVSLVAAVCVKHLSSHWTNFHEFVCVEGAVMSIKFMIG